MRNAAHGRLRDGRGKGNRMRGRQQMLELPLEGADLTAGINRIVQHGTKNMRCGRLIVRAAGRAMRTVAMRRWSPVVLMVLMIGIGMIVTGNSGIGPHALQRFCRHAETHRRRSAEPNGREQRQHHPGDHPFPSAQALQKSHRCHSTPFGNRCIPWFTHSRCFHNVWRMVISIASRRVNAAHY